MVPSHRIQVITASTIVRFTEASRVMMWSHCGTDPLLQVGATRARVLTPEVPGQEFQLCPHVLTPLHAQARPKRSSSWATHLASVRSWLAREAFVDSLMRDPRPDLWIMARRRSEAGHIAPLVNHERPICRCVRPGRQPVWRQNRHVSRFVADHGSDAGNGWSSRERPAPCIDGLTRLASGSVRSATAMRFRVEGWRLIRCH